MYILNNLLAEIKIVTRLFRASRIAKLTTLQPGLIENYNEMNQD